MLPPPSREAASRDGGGGRWRPRRSLSAWAAALRGSARHEAAEAAADLGEGWARARLLTSLTAQLLRFCRPSWLARVAGLAAFTALLLPSWLQVGWVYFTSRSVSRGLRYGPGPRQTFDLFTPTGAPPPGGWPVVVFVTGGMWIIGFRAWGALLAQRLRSAGVLVACLDYRNFPQGTVGAMAGDVALGAAFCAQRCASWGGDSSRVLLVGQSAGAHLAALALMRAAKEEEEEAAADADAAELTPPPPPAAAAAAAAAAPRLSPRSFARFVGISGVYTPDDPLLLDHFERRGLDRPLLYAIMEAGLDGRRAAAALPAASPVAQLRAPGAAAWAARLPGVTLLHGGADASAPPSQSAALAAALRAAGRPPSSVAELYYEGKTHTDPFLEDPVLGGRDVLMEDLLRLVGAPPPWPVFRRMQPAASVRLARRCIPF